MTKEQAVANYMKNLKISKEEAEQLYEDDLADYIGEEGEEMTQKAKEIRRYEQKAEKSDNKPAKKRTVKTSDEKVALFAVITESLATNGTQFEILKENKLIQVVIGDKIFKIDLIEQRKGKNQQVAQKCNLFFCAKFFKILLDKRLRMWYNGGPFSLALGRIFCQEVDCTIFAANLCVFCLLLLSHNVL